MNDNKTITRLFWTIAAAVCLIAAGSFVWSFLSLWELAEANSSQAGLGWIWPLIVDLSMLIYTGSILVAQLQRRGAKLPIALTIFYSLVTIAGNVLHAPQTPLGWFVAILPPLSLIFGAETLRLMGKHIIERQAAIQTLNELSALATTRRGELVDLQNRIEQATAKAAELKAELSRLRSEKRATGYQAIGDDTRAAAMEILHERPGISGAELGRLLGRSDTLARRLKRELLPALNGNGHNGVTQ